MIHLNTASLTFRVQAYINHQNADLPGIWLTAGRISDELFENRRTVDHDIAVARVLFLMSAKNHTLKIAKRARVRSGSFFNHTYVVR